MSELTHETLPPVRTGAAPPDGGAAMMLRTAHRPAVDLVGRDDELARIRTALDRAADGTGTLLVVSGEDGTGKTTLAEAAAAAAVAMDAVILRGRCWDESGTPPLWVWTQVLREALQMGREGWPRQPRALAAVLPELAGDEVPPAPPPGPARFALFEAVRAALAELAGTRSVLLILDDVHAADVASIELLRYVAEQLRGLPLVVLATYRPRGARCDAEAERLLAAVVRESAHLALSGLDAHAVRALLDAAGVPADDASARRLVEATAGNARLVRELVIGLGALDRPLHAADDLPMPEGLRAAVRGRLRSLDADARALVGPAAVLGPELEVGRLGALVGWDRQRLLDALGGCLDAGVLTELAERPGRYRFRQPIMQQTLLALLPPAERAALHARAAELIEDTHAADLDLHLEELARHYRCSAPEDLGRALEVTIGAASRCEAEMDLARAARHWRGALDLAERGATDLRGRCDILLALGTAEGRAGDNACARRTFHAAADVARAAGDWTRFARAALGSGGTASVPTAGVVDPMLLSLLDEALERLDPGALGLRAEVLARLALERRYVDGQDRLDELTGTAVALARRCDDSRALGRALGARQYILWDLARSAEDRLADTDELLDVARRSDDAELALQARAYRIQGYLEVGDALGLDREIAIHARLAGASGLPFHRWNAHLFAAMRALLDGRLDDALREADEALDIGERQDASDSGAALGPNARMLHTAQLFYVRSEQGRAEELREAISAYCRDLPTLPSWPCALALLDSRAGRRVEARKALDRLAAGGFAALSQDANWLPAMTLLAEAVAELGDVERARELVDLLAPHEGIVAVAGVGAVCRGSVSHYLGLLRASLGQHEAAVGHLEAALEQHEALGARPLAMRTRLALAGSLRALGADPARVAELLTEARATAAELGFTAAATEAELALEHGTAPLTPSRGRSPVPASVAALTRTGERWTFEFEGRSVQVRQAKGVAYLAQLLAQPGADVPAVALEQRAGGDARTLEAARRRYDELQEDLDDGAANGDAEKVALARERMAALAADLTASADRSEQARLNVTRAIRTALRNIAGADRGLGDHLQHTVRTGASCSYRPDPRVPITWRITSGAPSS